MDSIRLPGFVWTALIAAATAGLLALGDGLAGVADWWAPLAVALVGAALKAIQEATAKSQVIELVDGPDPITDGSRSVDGSPRMDTFSTVTKVELELPPFWQRFLLG